MKKSICIYILTLSLTLLTNSLYSQSDRVKAKYRELEILERLNNQIQQDNAREKKAKNIVLSYYFDLKDEIRKNRGKMSDTDYNNLIFFHKNTWESKIEKRVKMYNSSYYRFLNAHEKYLKKYREYILDELSSSLYQFKRSKNSLKKPSVKKKSETVIKKQQQKKKLKNNLKTESYILKKYIKSDKIFLREKPNSKSEISYRIPSNSKVLVVEKTNNKYWEVFINGHRGFIAIKDLYK